MQLREGLDKDDLVYLISRALAKRLHPYGNGEGEVEQRLAIIRSCEFAVRRMATEPTFANPARFLFGELRHHFPLTEQLWVRRSVDHHVRVARKLLEALPDDRSACGAFTRQGEPCRRRPVGGSEYCPSHRHLEV